MDDDQRETTANLIPLLRKTVKYRAENRPEMEVTQSIFIKKQEMPEMFIDCSVILGNLSLLEIKTVIALSGFKLYAGF